MTGRDWPPCARRPPRLSIVSSGTRSAKETSRKLLLNISLDRESRRGTESPAGFSVSALDGVDSGCQDGMAREGKTG